MVGADAPDGHTSEPDTRTAGIGLMRTSMPERSSPEPTVTPSAPFSVVEAGW